MAILALTGTFSICDIIFMLNKSDYTKQLFVCAFFDARYNFISYFSCITKNKIQQINHSIRLCIKFYGFFSLKLYIQYFRQKRIKFKFKKRILKLEISTSKAYIFLTYVSLIIFTYRKL